ncbi:MAG: LacI family DNA-binding transcriptional regulator [Clostridia bacterium]|nr:LacI family DNA-binding transcriptional regulator [Clostridia bacterium]
MSISTVSKVFNDYPDISEDTRKQVLKLAREMGYQPNALARALKTNRSYNLGVLFVDENTSGLMHPFFAAMLNAFKAEAEAHGYDITFINHNIGSMEMTYLEHCHYRNVDGVCLACVDFYSAEVAELVNSDIPSATVDHVFNNRPCIASDNMAGIRMLVRHAAELGHRRIAYIHGQRNSSVTETRISGFYREAQALGLPVPEGYVVEGRYDDVTTTRKLVTALLERPDRPTCVLLPDDASVFGAMEAARAKGLVVGRDLSVAGYDGIRLTQSLYPRLTTVFQDSEAMGRQAAQRLIDRVEHPNTAPSELVMIPVKLIEGDTIADLRGNL